MEWKRFDNTTRRFSGPRVSIRTNGTIHVSLEARQMIGSPRAVLLMFSQEDRLIGFSPADINDPSAYAFVTAGGPTLSIIAGRAMLDHYGIDYSTLRAFVPYMDAGILCVALGRKSGDK